jgi:hypothetical protein
MEGHWLGTCVGEYDGLVLGNGDSLGLVDGAPVGVWLTEGAADAN